jgi:hypothetical protein
MFRSLEHLSEPQYDSTSGEGVLPRTSCNTNIKKIKMSTKKKKFIRFKFLLHEIRHSSPPKKIKNYSLLKVLQNDMSLEVALVPRSVGAVRAGELRLDTALEALMCPQVPLTQVRLTATWTAPFPCTKLMF